MKLVLLLPLALLAAAPAPPARRVIFNPLTPAAYAQARRLAPNLPEPRTFPLRKRQGKIRVPTVAGYRVFKDKTGPQETDAVTYTYLGYLPRTQQHLLQHSYWAAEERLVEVILAVQRDGRILEFNSEPIYSPNQKRVVVFWQFVDYDAMINRLELLEQQPGKTKLLWEAAPATWEPAEVFWATDSTVYIKQERYKRRQTELSSGVPYKPARFTYAKLLLR